MKKIYFIIIILLTISSCIEIRNKKSREKTVWIIENKYINPNFFKPLKSNYYFDLRDSQSGILREGYKVGKYSYEKTKLGDTLIIEKKWK